MPAGAATKQTTIKAEGGPVVKLNQYIQDTQRFTPGDITVKPGATVKLTNKSSDGAPHSLSLLTHAAMPKTAKQIMECAACGPLIGAHEANLETGEVKNALVDVGQPRVRHDGDQDRTRRLDLPGRRRPQCPSR